MRRYNSGICGRYEFHSTPAAVALAFDLKYPPDIQPRHNIAPTQPVPIIRINSPGEHELSQVRWGLGPFWAKDPAIGNQMINATAETIAVARRRRANRDVRNSHDRS